MRRISRMLGGLLAAALLFAGCADGSDRTSSPSGGAALGLPAEADRAEDGVASGEDDSLARLLLTEYILPYEYYCVGQAWDYSDPGYTPPYDPDDIFTQQILREQGTQGFALSLAADRAPEAIREEYTQMEYGSPVCLIPGALHDAVSRFYFGGPPEEVQDTVYTLDPYADGMPDYSGGEPYTVKDGLQVSLSSLEHLENGDIRVVINRTLGGQRPALQGEYVFHPFVVEEIPHPLLAHYHQQGDTAYRFLAVADIPAEAAPQTVEISSPEALIALAQTVNSGDGSYLANTYILTGDIDLNGVDFSPIGQYTPQGIHDPASSGFGAVFDGQGHTIHNLSVSLFAGDDTENYYGGLFAVIAPEGEVRGLHLENAVLSLTAPEGGLASNALGGLAGTCFGAVSGCSVTGSVDGVYQVGGLVGVAGWKTEISGCSANVRVSGYAETGGFAGTVHNAVLRDCLVEGEVTAVDGTMYEHPRAIGGFAGFNVEGALDGCRSSVFVKTLVSSDWVGGFIGYNQGGNLQNCAYDREKAANWEAVDVEYGGVATEVQGLSSREFSTANR